MFSLRNTTKENQPPSPDKVLYLGCGSSPITFAQLEAQVEGAANSILLALDLIEGVRDQRYNDDRAVLMGAIVILRHSYEYISNLTPNWEQGD